jgi:hypothetical protein
MLRAEVRPDDLAVTLGVAETLCAPRDVVRLWTAVRSSASCAERHSEALDYLQRVRLDPKPAELKNENTGVGCGQWDGLTEVARSTFHRLFVDVEGLLESA